MLKLVKEIPTGFYIISQGQANIRKDNQGFIGIKVFIILRMFIQTQNVVFNTLPCSNFILFSMCYV